MYTETLKIRNNSADIIQKSWALTSLNKKFSSLENLNEEELETLFQTYNDLIKEVYLTCKKVLNEN